MRPSLSPVSVLLACTLLHEVDSQNRVKSPTELRGKPMFLINEVNADNPGEDALEYLELYHSSGRQVLLDGYSVVLYNGNGNTAYYVKDLGGLSTNDEGFLLLGSQAVVPTPKVILPKNTIQNGPDAIALYFGRTDLVKGMKVTNESLVDALVHKSKPSDRADELVRILTPGVEPFLEDPSFRTSDESLERCHGLGSRWFFQVGAPTPGSDNHCIPFEQLDASSLLISEVNPVDAFVELQGLPSTEVKDLVLVLVNGSNQEVSFVMDVHGWTSPDGLLLLGSDHDQFPVDVAFPHHNISAPLRADASAVALYRGNASHFSVGDPVLTSDLLDALIYTIGEHAETKLQDTLTPGKSPFRMKAELLSNYSSISRCVCCGLTRDPSAFILDQRTPGQINDCPKKRFRQGISLCFQAADCQREIPEENEIVMFLSQALEKQCDCPVSPAYFKGSAVACQNGELVFTAQLTARSAAQLQSLSQSLLVVSQSKEVVLFGNRHGMRLKPCSKDANGTERPTGAVSEEPRVIQTTSTPQAELLISEVNPDNPGSREDTEYIELFYPGPAPFELENYWLIFYNGKNNLAYKVVSLGGHRTNEWGYFLVGNAGVAPKPSIVLPDNTIQNGADAVVLYHSTKPIYHVNQPPTVEGLVDAVVYTARGSDRADKLLAILTPGQSILYENDSYSTEDESLSRCYSLRPQDHSSFKVTEITPLYENACTAVVPKATDETPHNHSVVISEVGVATSPAPYQFVELKGPSGARLKGYSLMLFSGHDAKPYASVPLQGTFASNGMFLVLPEGQPSKGNDHEQLVNPSLWSDPSAPQKSHGVALFRHMQAPNGTLVPNEILEDVVVFSWETGISRGYPGHSGSIYLIPRKGDRPLSLSRCSSCNETFALSDPTPGLENDCPHPSQYLDLGMCLLTPNCSLWPQSPPVLASLRRALVISMEESCSCRVSPCYIQELDFTCLDSVFKLSGRVLSRSEEQLQLLTQWRVNFSASPNPFPVEGRLLKVNAACPPPNGTPSRSKVHSFRPWETALIVVGSILLALLLAAVAVYWIKRRPQNYTTIELNDRCEIMANI